MVGRCSPGPHTLIGIFVPMKNFNPVRTSIVMALILFCLYRLYSNAPPSPEHAAKATAAYISMYIWAAGAIAHSAVPYIQKVLIRIFSLR